MMSLRKYTEPEYYFQIKYMATIVLQLYQFWMTRHLRLFSFASFPLGLQDNLIKCLWYLFREIKIELQTNQEKKQTNKHLRQTWSSIILKETIQFDVATKNVLLTKIVSCKCKLLPMLSSNFCLDTVGGNSTSHTFPQRIMFSLFLLFYSAACSTLMISDILLRYY